MTTKRDAGTFLSFRSDVPSRVMHTGFALVLVRLAAAAAAVLLLGSCAIRSSIRHDDSVAPPLPATDAGEPAVRDLRGEYRAALCARAGMAGDRCASTLQRFAGEREASLPPRAEPDAYRLVFVPGFLSSCVPGFNTFADVIAAARAAGFEAQLLDVGGRGSVEANAAQLALQIGQLPDDGRRLLIVGHSKGVLDALAAMVLHPHLAQRVAAVIGVAGAFNGSPLADQLRGLYRVAVASNPLLRCESGAGDELEGLRPEARRAWWRDHGRALTMPVYALVALPDAARVSPVLALTHGRLAEIDRHNDGQLLARDQVAPGGILLGYINVDHLEAAIPRPRRLPWTMLMAHADVPRADIVLAAIDAIAADLKHGAPPVASVGD